MSKSWYDKARAVIGEVHVTLPKDASLSERKKALRDAYPFGPREYHPYKMWCKAQREYLAKFDGRDAAKSAKQKAAMEASWTLPLRPPA